MQSTAATMSETKLIRLKHEILSGVKEQLERQSAMLQPNRFALNKALEDIKELVRSPQAYKNMRLIKQKRRKFLQLEKRFAGLPENKPAKQQQSSQTDEGAGGGDGEDEGAVGGEGAMDFSLASLFEEDDAQGDEFDIAHAKDATVQDFGWDDTSAQGLIMAHMIGQGGAQVDNNGKLLVYGEHVLSPRELKRLGGIIKKNMPFPDIMQELLPLESGTATRLYSVIDKLAANQKISRGQVTKLANEDKITKDEALRILGWKKLMTDGAKITKKRTRGKKEKSPARDVRGRDSGLPESPFIPPGGQSGQGLSSDVAELFADYEPVKEGDDEPLDGPPLTRFSGVPANVYKGSTDTDTAFLQYSRAFRRIGIDKQSLRTLAHLGGSNDMRLFYSVIKGLKSRAQGQKARQAWKRAIRGLTLSTLKSKGSLAVRKIIQSFAQALKE